MGFNINFQGGHAFKISMDEGTQNVFFERKLDKCFF